MRDAVDTDLPALLALEQACFSSDRLSRRQFRHWLKASNKVFLVAEDTQGQLLGYGLVIMRNGTRLARLYSLAVAQTARGQGLGKTLLEALEQRALDFDRLFMRLEVAKHNASAIKLYESLGYRTFGVCEDYYEDHSDALRMQKAIKQSSAQKRLPKHPWYQQTTEFTCGPASLMMAMAKQGKLDTLSQTEELSIWREATTIFMTSGHGGCHPLGLALAAHRRGLQADVFMTQAPPLFANGVRSAHKKQVLAAVENTFLEDAQNADIPIHYGALEIADIENAIKENKSVMVLISTYQLDGRKVPHWVTVTAFDDHCLFLHDPYIEPEKEQPMDCQHIPIAKQDFPKLSCYGKDRLRTALVLSVA